MNGRITALIVRLIVVTAIVGAVFADQRTAEAQGPVGQAPAATSSARVAAPIDLTGNWVSFVTEDWRWRMVTPSKGDYAAIPLTPEGKRVADGWDPVKDTAAGEQCRSYGAAGIMRVPTRLRISWQDDNTLKIETDAGTQTRLLHFGSQQKPEGPATWQGHSVAEWDVPGRTLKVVTTHMRPGYVRKNGVAYSAAAVLTEYWEVHRAADTWLVVTSRVDDPKYFRGPYVTSPNFKKEPDGSKWDPTPCSATW